MKKQEQGKLNLDRILNVFAIVAGIVALFFSWQANNIASRQVTARIVVLSSDYNGADFNQFKTKTNTDKVQAGHSVVKSWRCGNIISGL